MTKSVKPILIDVNPVHGAHSVPKFEIGEMVLVESPRNGTYHAVIEEFTNYYDNACVVLVDKEGSESIEPIGNISKY